MTVGQYECTFARIERFAIACLSVICTLHAFIVGNVITFRQTNKNKPIQSIYVLPHTVPKHTRQADVKTKLPIDLNGNHKNGINRQPLTPSQPR